MRMKWVWRILGGIVALVLLCILGLWLAGFRSGAGKNSATVVINRPAVQVWRYLNNDDLVLKWVSHLNEIRQLTPGVSGAGKRFAMAAVTDNQRTDMEMEITDFVPNSHIGFRLKSPEGVSPGFTETGEYVLAEEDGRTTVTLSGESKYFPFWVQLMEPMITPAAQKKLEGDLARLKALVEAEPVAGNP
jgi:uncharacterized protein YndB with AHSA1/START domain